MDVEMRPGYLRGDIGPAQRLADEHIIVRVPQRRLGVELQPELPITDQLAKANARAFVFRADLTIHRLDIADRTAEALRTHAKQRLARRRRRLANLHAAMRDPRAAARCAL